MGFSCHGISKMTSDCCVSKFLRRSVDEKGNHKTQKPEMGNRNPEAETGIRNPETRNRNPESGIRNPQIKENKFLKFAKVILHSFCR